MPSRRRSWKERGSGLVFLRLGARVRRTTLVLHCFSPLSPLSFLRRRLPATSPYPPLLPFFFPFLLLIFILLSFPIVVFLPPFPFPLVLRRCVSSRHVVVPAPNLSLSHATHAHASRCLEVSPLSPFVLLTHLVFIAFYLPPYFLLATLDGRVSWFLIFPCNPIWNPSRVFFLFRCSPK